MQRSTIDDGSPLRNWSVRFGLIAWIATVGGGTLAVTAYSNQAGEAAATSAHAMALAASPGPATTDRHRLFMFVHPHCPCTRAGLRELARIMARCAPQLEATIYLYRPANERDAWTAGATASEAAAIPGVLIRTDPDGKTARHYGAATSGDVRLYDPSNRLRFHGGITAARGHEGDNRGRSAVTSIVLGEATHVDHSPVFGCRLFAE